MPHRTIRVEFTKEHDVYLAKYLAKYCPSQDGRRGVRVYEILVANEQRQWPWAVHHTSQSWRERYVKHRDKFDHLIRIYQEKQSDKSGGKRRRNTESIPIEMLGPGAKRPKCGQEKEEEEGPSGHVLVSRQGSDIELTPPLSEAAAASSHGNAGSPGAKPTSKSLPEQPRKVPETSPQVQNLTHEAEPTGARRVPPTPPSPTPCTGVNASATRKPTLDSSSADRQALPLTDGIHEARGSSRPVKRIKVRTPSDMFVSESSSPPSDPTPVDKVEGPPSQTQPTPSQVTPNRRATTVPIPSPLYPRAPPRVVNSFHGQVLVDRRGHVPRTFSYAEKDVTEEEVDKEDKVQWPPARGHTAKQTRPNGPVVVAEVHHAFSQLPPQLEASHESDELPLDRRSVAARFTGKSPGNVAHRARVRSEQREEVIQNGASPVRRIVTTALPSDPFAVRIPKPLSKAFKFPAPRASTLSPFRPKPSPEKTRHLPPQPRTITPRHLVLNQRRRQTTGGSENHRIHEHEPKCEYRRGQVPSLDLVALSHSSVSSGSYSRSFMDTSVLPRPSRWSLPVFAHATPWVFDAPSPAYSDIWRKRSGTSTSTPQFMLTPSPTRSITGVDGSGSHVTVTPHPPDLQLTASHGLASILAHMSTNHGLALSVVEAVYKKVGSLREADEVLKGMREAAEGFGEREIKRRVRERRKNGGWKREEAQGSTSESGSGSRRMQLRYVIASEDGEGSEYSPPETSRAALWKRQSETASYGEEGENGRQGDDEEAEGRVVEEELQDVDDQERDDETRHHDFSQRAPQTEAGQEPREDAWEEERVAEALVEDTRTAHTLEMKVGKGRYRRDIAKRFV